MDATNPVQKIRITLLCARSLAKRDLFRLPDPFVRVSVEPGGPGAPQIHCTEPAKSTVDPKWNSHFDLMIGTGDAIIVSVWNEKKANCSQNPSAAAFLGCVRLLSTAITRLKDTGYQRLDLVPDNNAPLPVKGQIVISLLSRDGHGAGSLNAVVDNLGNLSASSSAIPSTTSAALAEDLPWGWELRRTANGRPYYVNHHSKSTQWTRPEHNTFGNLVAPASSNTDPTPPPLPERNPTSRSRVSAGSAQSQGSHRRQGLSSIQPPLPAGYEARITPQGQMYFFHLSSGISTWHDPRVPKDLMQVINTEQLGLNQVLGPFPSGWELRMTPAGREYYVDHNRKTTQFTDPRLTGSCLQRLLDKYAAKKEAPPPSLASASTSASVSTSAPTRSAGSASNRNESNATPQPSASSATRGASDVSNVRATTANVDQEALSSTSTNGKVEINKTTDSADVLPKYKRDLVAKIKVLRQELARLQPPSGHCRLEISRTDVFEDSYRLIVKMRPKDLRKRLMIKFKDEDGLDYGGIAREWLHLLSQEMLNPYYGLFQYSRDDIYTLQINADSAVNPDHLSYFHFCGRIIGMAVFHGHYVDGGFTMPFYKMLLNKPITLDDIEGVDPSLHKGLNWMLDNNIDGDGDEDSKVFDTTFSVEHEAFGVVRTHELKEGGKNIPVTEANKREYVKLYVNYRWCHGIEQQFLALHKGFHEVVPQHNLRPFDERELELLIGGIGKIDIVDWKTNTRLKHCNPDTQVVKWFWDIVEGFSEEMRARLLQFVTGSSRVPLQGFKALQGSTGAAGPRLFTLHLVEVSTNNLPKAHTCFNRLDLPPYETKEKMTDKLTQAVEETCGFAVE